MLEIEQKFASADFAALQARLAALRARQVSEVVEVDHYYNGPDRDFAQTGEAFRLRRIGPENFLTYKGPKAAHAVKTRTELEVPLPPGDQAAREHGQLLEHLGYRPVAEVRKRRQSFQIDRPPFALTVCLDDVDELDRFAEVEVLAPPEQVEGARAAVASLAAELGLSQVEPRAYLTMLLAARAARASCPPMRVVENIAELRQAVRGARGRRLSVGLVPTMGALHAGHLSLIEKAREQTGFVVVSLFVNPTQFAPGEDFERYPRPLADDLAECEKAGVDLVYRPSPAVMYPPGYRTRVEVTGLQDVLCGVSRPGHFRGVATVVLKLFNQVQPDRAYFGQKDGQQARIIRQLVRDLDLPIEIVVCPTVREADGLALSSRNQYLRPEQRRNATALFAALNGARQRIETGERNARAIRRLLEERLAATPGAQLDYAAVVDADTLAPLDRLSGAVLLALAVKFGDTRLIDNIQLEVTS